MFTGVPLNGVPFVFPFVFVKLNITTMTNYKIKKLDTNGDVLLLQEDDELLPEIASSFYSDKSIQLGYTVSCQFIYYKLVNQLRMLDMLEYKGLVYSIECRTRPAVRNDGRIHIEYQTMN
jgi:hypothetical protein